jgi:hypothetical protein
LKCPELANAYNANLNFCAVGHSSISLCGTSV